MELRIKDEWSSDTLRQFKKKSEINLLQKDGNGNDFRLIGEVIRRPKILFNALLQDNLQDRILGSTILITASSVYPAR